MIATADERATGPFIVNADGQIVGGVTPSTEEDLDLPVKATVADAEQLIAGVRQQHQAGICVHEMKLLWFETGKVPYSVIRAAKDIIRNAPEEA